jgi:hypothetical protein
MNPNEAADIYRRLKVAHPEKLRTEARSAMVRFSEEHAQAEKSQLDERKRKLEPVYLELEAALRRCPELAGVIRTIDLHKWLPRPSTQSTASKRLFVLQKPLTRLDVGSMHIVDTLPFFSDTWTWQVGEGNDFNTGPSANGTTGDMSFDMRTGNGQMACWAALGAQIAIPNSACVINFTANPSVNWSYDEYSTWWRETSGNMWAGQFVTLHDASGSLLGSPVNTQMSVASFDDRNLVHSSGWISGSNSAMNLLATILIGLPFSNSQAEGGFLQYWCWIGGNCNGDNSNTQSGCRLIMSANCSDLIVDIQEF